MSEGGSGSDDQFDVVVGLFVMGSLIVGVFMMMIVLWSVL